MLMSVPNSSFLRDDISLLMLTIVSLITGSKHPGKAYGKERQIPAGKLE